MPLSLYPSPPPSFPLPPIQPRSRDGVPNWKVTTHAFPAAYPRTRNRGARPLDGECDQALFHWRGVGDAKKELSGMIDTLEREKPRSEEDRFNEEGLWIAANRYWKNEFEPDGYTLVLAHASSLHKETWEPVISRLFEQKSLKIREIWCLDHILHGDSAVLNDGRIGDVYDWIDSGRDIVQFILRYLPPSGSDLSPSTDDPFLLSPQCSGTINLRDEKVQNLQGRLRGHQIALIGHSAGGTAQSAAASMLPHLFERVILFDPMITTGPRNLENNAKWTLGGLKRKDRWNSAEEARSSLLSKPLYKQWDPAAQNLYCQHAIKKDGSLKCKRENEALTYVDRYNRIGAVSDDFFRAPVASRVHIHFADAGKGVQPDSKNEAVLKMLGNASWDRAKEGVTHLMVQQDPAGSADAIVKQLLKTDVVRRAKL
ncbi:hypothetical protein BT69DRAFT_1056496 [Atractiella rhizophila]|nr:hypothetical protein BT69DRAFT_1056496 [Atractiella rhizophila]